MMAVMPEIQGRLTGQVAIVTGAGTGIGRAVAQALASEGARLVLVGRRPEPLRETAATLPEGAAMVMAADVTAAGAPASIAGRALEAWHRIDVLVNNAGVNLPARALDEVSLEGWRQVVDINLNGVFALTQAVLPVMRAQQSGTIVNISSVAGLEASLISGPAYSASKAAVNSFTESINLAERHRGIRACAVCPGEVATPILKQRPKPPPEAAFATMLQPEDLAAIVLLVATLPARAAVELVHVRPTILRQFVELGTEESRSG